MKILKLSGNCEKVSYTETLFDIEFIEKKIKNDSKKLK